MIDDDTLLVYKVVVPVTNIGTRNAFRINDDSGCSSYGDCEDGIVYVIAKDAAEAGKKVPMALAIERVGLVFRGVPS